VDRNLEIDMVERWSLLCAKSDLTSTEMRKEGAVVWTETTFTSLLGGAHKVAATSSLRLVKMMRTEPINDFHMCFL
jgi:hypothetical protein